MSISPLNPDMPPVSPLIEAAIGNATAGMDKGNEAQNTVDNVLSPIQAILTYLRLPMGSSLNLAEIVSLIPEGPVELINDVVLRSELAFQIPRTIIVGSNLAYRTKGIENAEKLCALLQDLRMNVFQDHPDLRLLDEKIELLNTQIEKEKASVKRDTKSFVVSILTYIPRGGKVIGKLFFKVSAVAKAAFIWLTVFFNAIKNYRAMRAADKNLTLHTKLFEGEWKKTTVPEGLRGPAAPELLPGETPSNADELPLMQARKAAFESMKERVQLSFKETLLNQESLDEFKQNLLDNGLTALATLADTLDQAMSTLSDRSIDAIEDVEIRDLFNTFVDEYTKFQETSAIIRRDVLKADLTNINLEKQEAISSTLHFESHFTKADFVISLLLGLLLATMETVALFVALGSLMLIPHIAVPVVIILMVLIGVCYSIKENPNLALFKIKNCLRSLWYPLKQSIAMWQLKRQQTKYLQNEVDLQGARLDLIQRQRLLLQDGEDDPEIILLQAKIGDYEVRQEQLKLDFDELNDAVKLWDDKMSTLKMESLNAELADLGWNTTLNGDEGLAHRIHEDFFGEQAREVGMHDQTRQMLKDNLGIDVEALGESASEEDIIKALLNSLLAKEQSELFQFIEAIPEPPED